MKQADITTRRLLASGLSGMRAAELAIRAEFGCPPRDLICGCCTDGRVLCDDHAPAVFTAAMADEFNRHCTRELDAIRADLDAELARHALPMAAE